MGRMSEEKKALGLTKDQLNPGNPDEAGRYSEIVYRKGGPYRWPKGGTFDCRGVASEEELEEALDSGWFRSAAEAIKGGAAEAESIAAEIAKIKAEKQLEADLKELEELRKWKAQKEGEAVETPATNEFTPEELHRLYLDNDKDWKKVTDLTGVKSPHLRCQKLLKADKE